METAYTIHVHAHVNASAAGPIVFMMILPMFKDNKVYYLNLY